MSADYIDFKIDTDRDTNGAELADELRKGAKGGIPWIVITDAAGNGLITGDAPESGNIGCPVTEPERAWFIEMLRQTRKRMTDEQLATVEAGLAAYAKELGR